VRSCSDSSYRNLLHIMLMFYMFLHHVSNMTCRIWEYVYDILAFLTLNNSDSLVTVLIHTLHVDFSWLPYCFIFPHQKNWNKSLEPNIKRSQSLCKLRPHVDIMVVRNRSLQIWGVCGERSDVRTKFSANRVTGDWHWDKILSMGDRGWLSHFFCF
jgi:hypothetical protein